MYGNYTLFEKNSQRFIKTAVNLRITSLKKNKKGTLTITTISNKLIIYAQNVFTAA